MKAIALALLALATGAQAALYQRGDDLVYDDATDLTWFRSATAGAGTAFDDGYSSTDGGMSFASATAWVDQVSVQYAGKTFTDWRLSAYMPPTTGPGELRDLIERSLGNTPANFPANWGPFSPLPVASPISFAWLGTPYAEPPPLGTFLSVAGWVVRDAVHIWPPTLAWAYGLGAGSYAPGVVQLDLVTGESYQQFGYAWAMRSGDVAAVPEPATWLLMAGGLVLIARRRSRRGHHAL